MAEDKYLDDDSEDFGEEIEFKPAKTADDFKEKAQILLSNTIDVLNVRITSGMAESSDLKTALEIGKHFKVGIESVDEAAERAMRESKQMMEIEDNVPDSFDSYSAMRFQD